MSSLRWPVGRRRRGAAAASGLGTARNQADRDRISTTPVDLLVLPHADLRRAATGRAGRSIRPASDCFHRLVDGLLQTKQTSHGEFLETLLGQPCSTGLTVKHQNLTAAALEPAYQQLVEQLPGQAQLGIDETATKQASHKAWLWTFVADGFTVFGIEDLNQLTCKYFLYR